MLHLVRTRLEQLLDYLKPLLNFANCHMVDYFTSEAFQTFIPPEIQVEINNSNPDTTINSIFNSTNECPNLQQFLSKCRAHTLPHLDDICLNVDQFELKLIEMGCKTLSGLHLKGFMSPKKSHEVQIMSEIAAAVTQIAKTTHVVDIGDGKGYLSSALALHNGLKVLGIDSSITNTNGAAKRIGKLKKAWKGLALNENPDQCDLYKQTTKFVTEKTDLKCLVKEHFPDTCDSISLVGLHTCGNLTQSCLKIFYENPNVRTICNVGCCYHYLEKTSGFPMSDFLIDKSFEFGRNAKMLSCQSLDRIISEKELPSTILFYRALLQIIILKYCPVLTVKQVGRFGHKSTTFLDYVHKAFKKFGTNVPISDSEVIKLFESYSEFAKQLQIFYLIRAHLAPIIEAVILLDRLLFLHEKCLTKSFLVQMFDPVISPRCYGIVAFK